MGQITLADYVVKVPHMADSISEGSLKQWNKSTYCASVCYCLQGRRPFEQFQENNEGALDVASQDNKDSQLSSMTPGGGHLFARATRTMREQWTEEGKPRTSLFLTIFINLNNVSMHHLIAK